LAHVRSVFSISRLLVPLGLAALLLTCGGQSPTGTTPPTTAPVTTQPPVTQPPVQGLCQRLGYVPTPQTRCDRQGAAPFQKQVDAAIAKAIAEHAEIFENGGGGIRILNPGKYVVVVVNNINEAGLCGGYDGEELQVKNSNDSNDQFDISSASGFVRSGDAAYRSSCAPASFPVAPPPPIQPPAGCSLPPSREIACGHASPTYIDDLNASIDEAVQQHPENYDTRDTKGASDGYRFIDGVKYHQQVADALTKRGYCALYDGEELQVKRSDEFTDHYDIAISEGYIRRGAGQYQSSCYPAAF